MRKIYLTLLLLFFAAFYYRPLSAQTIGCSTCTVCGPIATACVNFTFPTGGVYLVTFQDNNGNVFNSPANNTVELCLFITQTTTFTLTGVIDPMGNPIGGPFNSVTINYIANFTPTVSSNSPVCPGDPIQLNGPTIPGATYQWTGPGFSSTLEDPIIPSAGAGNSGVYTLVITQGPCTTNPGSTNVIVTPNCSISPVDCDQAVVVCGNDPITFTPAGPGVNDFAPPGNSAGCLTTLENNSAWYYFEIDAAAPANQQLAFTITPNGTSDYDFAVFGPDVGCGNLGSPIRCSWAATTGATGLAPGAGDNTENAAGDGFVNPLVVQPGEGYYLLVDNFSGTATGFTLTWSGPGANYLNCSGTPCPTADAGSDLSVCQGAAPFQLGGGANGVTTNPVYNWSGTAGSTAYLSAPNVPAPTVTLPAGFTGTITYTLTLTDGTCVDSDQMQIVVNPLPNVSINPAGPFCETAGPQSLSASPGGGTWGGAASPGGTINPSVLGAGIHSVSYTYTNPGTGCSNTATINITVNAAATPNLGTATVCQTGGPLNLNTLLDPAFPTGSWSGPGVSGSTFNPAGQSGNVTLTFTPTGSCVNPATTTITVNIPTTPSLGTATLCQTDAPLNLSTLQDPAFPTGSWSGPGVSGSTFNPAGQSGNITLTFTPSTPCSNPATTTVTVNVSGTPNLGTATLCQTDAPLNLSTLQDPAFPTGSWSGPGVSGSTFNPAGQSGNITLTFTPSTPCSNPATTTVTVNVAGTPSLGTATVCQTDGPLNLNTLLDPAFPSGTWSGPGVSGNGFNPAGQSGNVTLTFTPTGSCVNPATTTVTVNVPGTPNLGTATLCQTDAPLNLSTLQDPAFPTGSWSGPGVSGTVFNPAGQSGNVTLTFTPTGSCVNPATTTVTVNVPGTPNLGTATLCQTDAPLNLSTLQDPAFPTGSWSGPGVSGTAFNPAGQSGNVTLTFTPSTPCSNPATTTVTVNVAGTPSLGTATVCQTDGPLNLNTLLDPAFPSGTWSGPGVMGNGFNPAGQSGNVTLTFTPSTPCSNPATTTVTVNVPGAPNLGTATLCQTDAPLNLSTLQDPAFPTGSWSGPGVSGTTFNPAGQSGNVTLTFTPTGSCVNPATTTVTVNVPGTPNLGTATLCQTDAPLNLSTLQDPAFPTGNWSGPGVSGTTFNPAGQSGNVTLTFTPTGSCVNLATTTVTVNVPGTPNLGTATVCQTDGPLNLNTLLDPGFPSGTWSGSGVMGNGFNPAGQSGNVTLTFTPSTPCSNPATTTVTVNVPGTPNLGTATLCQTDAPLNLSTLQDPAFPTGTWSGPGVSGTTFNPAGQSGNVTLTFTPAGSCVNPATTTVTVNVPGTPNLGTATLCQTDGPLNLNTLLDPAFPSGTWSGPGVIGNGFDPAGQSGNVTLTFTPSTPCSNPATTTVTVDVPGTPNLGTATLCQTDAPLNLSTLQDPAFPTGSWSGPGVSGTTFNPAGQSGNVTLTFTPSTPCTNPATTTVTVDLPVTPNLGTANLCDTDAPLNLSTLQDPGFPAGNWSGPGVSGTTFNPAGQSGPVVLTFTPTAPCTNPATTTVTVSVAGTPVLGTASLCQSDGPFDLSTIQDINYPSGTWSGPGVSGATFNPAGQTGNISLTFTPAASCALPASTTITVNVPTTPILGTATLCATDLPLDLTTLQDPGFPSGTWSGPGVSGTTFNPNGQNGAVVLTFTPSTPCTNPANATINVDAPTTPNLGTATLCETDAPLDLTTLQDPGFPSGTWSGPGVSGTTFNPNGQNGAVVLTFTPSTPCTNPANATINITTPAIPNLSPANLCETDPPLDLTTLQDPGFPSGSWSGPGVSGSTFDPVGLSGPVILTFTSNTPCTNPANTTVTVSAAGTPILGTASLCQSDAPLDLTALQDINYPGGVWSGPGVSGTTFNPAGQSGNISLTFTPSASCALPASTTIMVNVPTTPNLGTATLCQTDAPLDLTTLQDPGFPSGTWSGPGVSGATFNPAGQSGAVVLTFTPSTPCTNPANATVNVNVPTTPNLGTATLCQTDAPLDLTTLQDPGFPSGTWSGPGVSGTIFNPAGQSGAVVLTFTPSTPCTNPANATVNVNVPTTPNLGTATLCQTDAPLDLTTLQDPGFPSGTWSGPGVSGTIFNPAGQSGAVVLTFTPSTPCTNPANATVNVNVPTTPNLGTATLCQTDAPLDLTTLQDPGFPSGTWSGPGVSGTIFNPAGQSGAVVLTFTPSTPCTNPANATVNVNVPTTPNLGTATLCQTDAPLNLTVLQDPGFPSGTWSGPGVSGTIFNPAGQSGAVVLTFTPSTPCTNPANATVNVNAPTTPILGTATLCETDGILSLIPLQDPAFPSGVWSGPGVSGSNFNPLGLSGPVVLTFTPNMPCTDPATTTVTVDNPQTPALGDANICETDGILSLIPLQDPAFPIGVWSGPGVSGSNFDPLGLSGPVVLLFTPSAPCTNAATTTVTVSAAGTPVLGTTTLCQTDGLFSLSALVDPLYPGGVWSGPGVSGNNFNPLGLSGSITLTFTPAASCAQPASTAITVNVPGTPDLGDATLCETDGLFSLAVLQDPAFPSGTWSGPGVSGNTFNPLGLSGPVNLLFTPSTACTNAATATITVNNPQTPVLGNANICETDGPFNLISLQDPAFPNGTWAGPGVSGNTFDPAGLLGPVNLLFTPSEPCTNQATTTITVSPAGTPILGTTTLCQSDGPFSLSALADPSYPGGIWSGPGVSGNTFNPLGLSGDVTLTFTPAASCALPNNTTVTVDVPQTPILGTTSVCEIQAPISLTGLQDPGFPNGTWSGPGVFGNTFDPLGLGGPITLVFTSSTPCTNPAITTIEVTPAAVPNLGTATICQNEGLFDLTTLNDPGFPNGAWSGPGVTNNALDPSGLGGPITVVFMPSTGCAVAAATTVEIIATQGLTTLLDPALCPDESIVVNGTVYDSNNPSGIEILTNYQGCDSTVIVELNLLSNSQTTIDDILCVGESLIVNGMIYDEANPNGTEMLPAANGCDSIIIINLTFNQNSSATVAPTLCEGESIVVNGTVYDENNPGGMEVLPAANGCDSIITIALTYLPNSQTALTPSLCPGESITVNGTVYNQLNPSGMEVLPAANGCDSIVTVSVILLNNVTENLQQTLCAGESLTINGTVYDESNPGGVEIMPAANGCDSILFVSLTFTPDVQVDLSPTLCTGQNLTVNGTIYDENNPSGVEVLAAANGCDSIINVSLLFLDTIVVDLSPTLCTGSSLIVNGTVYDEGNPSGSELLMASNGCDSLINVNLSFLDTIVVDLAPALCPGESIVVNGTVYDENNPSGAELMTANNGCDSLVNVNLSFNNDVTFELNSVLCSGESLLINGTVYDENNPSGLEVLAAANGCDSTVLINLSFNPDVQVDLSPVLCPGESITVNGTVYDQDNPAGVEVLPTAAGCDSIIFIQINIANNVTVNLSPDLCPGESLTVNGTVYDEGNPSGTEVLPTATGCDSIINVNLNFLMEATVDLSPILCAGESIVVNGVVYDEDNPTGTEVLQAVNGCDSLVNVSLTFNDTITVELTPTLCPGESLTLNGNTYDQNNPSGAELFTASNGCDSLVLVDLSFFSTSVTELAQTLCPGESITVNGVVYDESNPAGTEIFPDLNGCDSLVNVSLTFNDTITVELTPTLCPGESLTLNGNTYDQSNPSGAELFTASNGCDSLVLVELSFFSTSVTELAQTLCPGESITVNGVVYDESNPAGTEIFPDLNGCDSLVNVSLTFNDTITVELTPTLCPGESLTVNGNTYDQNNPSGAELFTAANGCDSLVLVDLSFFSTSVTELAQTLCPGESITVNGVVYDESNPAGTEIFPDLNGCDSLVNVSLTFNDTITVELTPTLCPGESLTLNGNTYDQNNPSGAELFTASNGCDSLVLVDLSFFSTSVTELAQTLCPGESITVNGVVYNEGNPAGTEIFPDLNGCDSLVNVSLTFNDTITVELTPTLCPGESLTLNGNTYDQTNPSGAELFTASNGCDSLVLVDLSFFNTGEVSLFADAAICAGETAQLTIVSTANGPVDLEIGGGTPIQLNGATNGMTVAVMPNGTTSYTIIGAGVDLNGCAVEIGAGATVVVSELVLSAEVESDFNGFGVSCAENADGEATALPSLGIPPYSYEWSDGQTTATATGLAPGSYTVEVEDASGCTATAEIELFAPPPLTLATDLETSGCFGEETGLLAITELSGGSPGYEWSLDGVLFEPLGALPLQLPPFLPGQYSLVVADQNDCETSIDFLVPTATELELNAGDDQTITAGESVQLNATANFVPVTVLWEGGDDLSCLNCLDPLASPPTTTTYTITAIDADGCAASDELTIEVEKERSVFIPNGFSPNGDGENDIFAIFAGPEVVRIRSFLIFSRWGEPVFQVYNFPPNDLNFGWDGRYRNQEMDPAVFTYFAELEFADGSVELYEGDVTLVR